MQQQAVSLDTATGELLSTYIPIAEAKIFCYTCPVKPYWLDQNSQPQFETGSDEKAKPHFTIQRELVLIGLSCQLQLHHLSVTAAWICSGKAPADKLCNLSHSSASHLSICLIPSLTSKANSAHQSMLSSQKWIGSVQPPRYGIFTGWGCCTKLPLTSFRVHHAGRR